MTLVLYVAGLLTSFLAGYGAASLGIDSLRRRYLIEEMGADEVELRTRTMTSNVVKLTPREEASLRSFVSWQVDPELLRDENAGA